MSDASNAKMLAMYEEQAEAPMFLAGLFRSPPQNFHRTEKVEIDILRDDEDIAIAVHDLSVGARANQSTLMTNKGYTPPILDEEGTITAYDQIKRQAGQDPYTDPDYAANATIQAFRLFSKLERKIRRTIELMASQVFQTGTVTLTDSAGVGIYTIDFQAKASHLVQCGVTAGYGAVWAADGSTGTPLADLELMAKAVRRDGKIRPNKLIFGSSAMQKFLANADVKAKLDNRGMNLGQVAPESRGEGATFQGWVWIGHYRFEMWMYDGFYRDPVTGNHTDYISPNNVVMTGDKARYDLSFGAIPLLRTPAQPAMGFLPPRMSSSKLGLDLSINAFFTPDGRQLKLQAGTRPLTIPTAIDTFARLTVA